MSDGVVEEGPLLAWFKVGLRNLIKNARRSLTTTLAIAIGFAAVNLFGGFAQYMHSSNQHVAIYVSPRGHLTFFKRGFLEEGGLDRPEYLFSATELQTVEKVCRAHPEVVLISPLLRISGILTNGEVSTIFIADGIVPSVRHIFLERFREVLLSRIQPEQAGPRGKPLRDDQDYGVAVSHGLADLLELEVGTEAVAFTNTASGQMNALDVEVFELFTTFSAMNDKSMVVPFSFAQRLYDTDGADRVTVLLNRTELTEKVRDELSIELEQHGLDVDITTWQEMSEWYRRVKEMFDTIFGFLFVIVFAIVVLSVINTVSIAVLERTREIGTLRALGLKRRGVMWLFGIESLLLGAFGSVAGVGLTLAGWATVSWLEPTWIPPNVPSEIIIRVELLPETMLYSFLLLLVLCLSASVVAARGAARRSIVDALGHV